MAQPTAYAPAHEFLTDEGANPNFPGSEIDIELNAIKDTTDEIRTNLALIQRDDGELANRIVGSDQLTDELRTGALVNFSQWASEVTYAAGAIVVEDDSFYRCLVAHTASTFATDLSNAKWMLLGDLPLSTTPGPKGDQGDKGWAPVLAVASDGERRVFQVADWSGGEGDKPAIGAYVGASGLVASIGDAVNVRGAAGSGDLSGPGAAAVGNLPTFANTDGTELSDSGIAASSLAPKASPTFTGAPAAPTASLGTNTTQIATTAFVKAAVDALLDSAPGALDTLNELAAALGDDPDFATTVTNALAAKAAKASNLSDLSSPHTGHDNLSVKGSDVASASTIDLDAATGSLLDVTGTTAITAITLAAGRRRIVRFTGALTLTNGASLILPGGANIVTAAGDFALFAGYASSVVRCVLYVKASGKAVIAPAMSEVTGTALPAVGYTATSYSAGTKSTGTFTPDPTLGNFQHATNGGAHTLAPPSSVCTMIIEYVNNGSAGAVTTSSFTYVTGDTIATTNGHKFMFFVVKTQNSSHLHVQKLQ